MSKSTVTANDAHIPAGAAAIKAHLSRERIVRLVQTGQLDGELVNGRWSVSRQSLDRVLAGVDIEMRNGRVA